MVTDFCEVEAKITSKASFSIKKSDWDKLYDKCNADRIPLMVVEFEGRKLSLAVLSFDDLRFFIDAANEHE